MKPVKPFWTKLFLVLVWPGFASMIVLGLVIVFFVAWLLIPVMQVRRGPGGNIKLDLFGVESDGQ